MPNNIIFDSTLNTLYIKLDRDNLGLVTTYAENIQGLNPHTVVLDIRGLEIVPDNIQLLISSAKTIDDVVTINDSKTSEALLKDISQISICSLSYEDIPFKSEEERKLFEEYPIDAVNHYSSKRTEKINTSSESEYLNASAKFHLKEILTEYGKYLSEEKRTELESLIKTDMVVVEKNHDTYAAFKKATGEEEDPKDYPSAHGGKVYGDKKIHFYLNKFKQDSLADMEGVLIHELFHYVISPEYTTKYPEEPRMNSFISEGLVDMYALDYMKKRSLFDNYQSNYPSEVIFTREKLKAMPDDETKHKLVLNGSIDQFIELTSKSEEDFIKDYQEAKNHETKFDKIISEISSYMPHHQDSYARNCMRLAARVSPEEALKIIKETTMELTPEMLSMSAEQTKALQDGVSKSADSYSSGDSSKQIS